MVFLLCAAVPVLILGFFSIDSAKKQMTEEYQSLTSQTAQRIRSILFDLTTSVYTLSDSALSGNDCMYLFAAEKESSITETYYEHISTALKNLTDGSAAIASAHIYTDNPMISDNAYISSLDSTYANEEWFAKLSDGSWCQWVVLSNPSTINVDRSQLSLVRRIPIATSAYTAYLVVCLDSNNTKNRIGEDEHLISVALDDGSIVYSNNEKMSSGTLAVPEGYSGQNSFSGEMKISGSPVLTSLRTLLPYKSDSRFLIEACDLSAFASISRITGNYLIIIGIVLAAIISIILFFSKRLARQELVNRQQEMEFKMLAAQINPHFLYNTLETIRMQALISQNRDVATSIKLLGKSMHYVLENTGTSFTTLDRELDHVKTYLLIQQIRFGDRINFSFDIDPDIRADKYPILPLLLQPIVENAVIHGLEDNTKKGFLTVAASSDETFLRLSVKDNGMGMNEEELTALRDQISRPGNEPDASRSSIGLRNIRQRIHLCYGDKASMAIESFPDEGTTVTLTLPHLAVRRQKEP